MDADDEGGVAVEELLRPPESWPGAGGLKSVAPEVPSWPRGPIRLPAAGAENASTAPVAASKTPGDGWPGLSGAAPVSERIRSDTEDKDASAATDEEAGEPTKAPQPAGPGSSRRTMSAALLLLVACVLVAVWVVLDPANRVLQLTVLAVVLVAGGVFVALTARQTARRR